MTAAAATPRQRLAALMASTSTPSLVISLQTLEAQRKRNGRLPEEESMTRAWIMDEIEKRFPVASKAVEQAFEATEAAWLAGDTTAAEVDYVAVLLQHVPSTSF